MSEIKETVTPGGRILPLTDIPLNELRRVLDDPYAMMMSQMVVNYLLEMHVGKQYYDVRGDELRSPWAVLRALARDEKIYQC